MFILLLSVAARQPFVLLVTTIGKIALRGTCYLHLALLSQTHGEVSLVRQEYPQILSVFTKQVTRASQRFFFLNAGNSVWPKKFLAQAHFL